MTEFKGLEKIFEGLVNEGIAKYAIAELDIAIRNNPFQDKLSDYEFLHGGLLTGLLGVYNPFPHEGREIYPKEKTKDFYRKGSEIYCMAAEGMAEVVSASFESGQMCSLAEVKGKEWVADLRTKIEEGISIAGDLSLWLVHLSKGMITGAAVRSKAAKYGITNIECLPEDVKWMGENALKFYDIFAGSEPSRIIVP